jgi:hypothetical protein
VAGGAKGSVDSVTLDGAFMLAFDANGNLLWSTALGPGEVGDFVLDSDGSIVVTGSTGGTITTGQGSAFLARLSASGSVQWQITFGDIYARGVSVGVEASGRITVIGTWTNPQNPGGWNVNLWWFDAKGVALDDLTFGGTDADYAFDLLVDEQGASYALVYAPNPYLMQPHLEKRSASGALLWSYKLDAIDGALAWADNGDLLVVSQHASGAESGGVVLAGSDLNDAVVLRIDRDGKYVDGKLLYSNQISGCCDEDRGFGVAVDPANGMIAMAGMSHYGDVSFGGSDASDVLIALLDSQLEVTGQSVALQPVADPEDRKLQSARDIAFHNGALVVVGLFAGTIQIGASTFTDAGNGDAFLVRMPYPPPPSP